MAHIETLPWALFCIDTPLDMTSNCDVTNSAHQM